MSFGNTDNNIFGSTSFGSFNNPSNDTNENINREATDEEKTQYKQRLNDLYSQHNPDKIYKVDEWINTYGKSLSILHSLYVKCCTKYNVNPEPIFNSQPENDNEQNNNTSWQILSNDNNNTENNAFNFGNNNTNTENNSFNWNTQTDNNEHKIRFNNEDNSNTNSSITWNFGTDSKHNNDDTNPWSNWTGNNLFDTDSKHNKNSTDETFGSFTLIKERPLPKLIDEKYKVITYDDIAFFARIHKNATKLIFGYVHINYNINESNDNDKIIPLEIYTIIVAFYPSEIPFYDHVFEVQMVATIDKVYVKNLMDKWPDKSMFDYDKKEKILKINRNSKDEHEIIQLRLYQYNAKDFHNYFGDLVMFLFDLTVNTTFENIQSLCSKLENENDIIKILVGYTIEQNNDDTHIQEIINIAQQQAKQCALVNGLKYIEICWNDEMNVHEMFQNIAIQIADKYDSNHDSFVQQWKSFNTTTKNNDDDDEKDNANNTQVIGTKTYLEKNDFKPLQTQDPTKNNKDRVYYYQNICLVDDIFKGKSPEELHFEDKYDKMAAKQDKRPVVKAKWSFGRNNNNNGPTSWSWKANDTNINVNAFVGCDKATQTDSVQHGAPTSEEIATYSERLREIYMVHNKTNLTMIPILLEKYGKTLDDMHGLYVKVCSKYHVEPKAKFVATVVFKQYGQNNINESVTKVNSIDEYIINEVSKQCKVSKEIAKQSLESSVWNVDIAMNKIKALQKFKCDLSIFEQKQDTENDEKDREATKDEIDIYKIKLEKIYERCNKEKLGNVMNLINKTKHKLSLLHELYVRVCSKYDIESDIVDDKKENDNSQNELIQNDAFSEES